MKRQVGVKASAVVAITYTLIAFFGHSFGRVYFSEVDWAEVNEMPYKEAQEYLLERSRSISRMEALKIGMRQPEVWRGILTSSGIYFALCMFACSLAAGLRGSSRGGGKARTDARAFEASSGPI